MKTFIAFILISVWLIWLFSGLCFAETITIPPEDMKDITIANLQTQVTSQNVVIKMLLKKSGCKIEADKLVCPDEKEDAKKPN